PFLAEGHSSPLAIGSEASRLPSGRCSRSPLSSALAPPYCHPLGHRPIWHAARAGLQRHRCRRYRGFREATTCCGRCPPRGCHPILRAPFQPLGLPVLSLPPRHSRHNCSIFLRCYFPMQVLSILVSEPRWWW
ncbi:unnamed protein product, partial [Ectocarpus sp. 12 AP-2014]